MSEDKNLDKSAACGNQPDGTAADRGGAKRRVLLLAMLALVVCIVVFLIVGVIRSLRGGGGGGEGKSKETLKALKEFKPVKLANIKLPGGVEMPMIEVKAGSFEMSRKDDANWSDETPHKVTFKNDFCIGRTEVTQAQWQAVMGSSPSYFKGADRPVEMVSWDDAMAFCAKLNALKLAPEGYKFTLPTEAQWEYAAAGGVEARGCKYSGSDELDEIGWYGDSGKGKGKDASAKINGETRPVAGKTPNELGIYDMSGNVWEWTLDDYSGESRKTKAEERLVISGQETRPADLIAGKPCPHCGQIVGEPKQIFCQYRTVRGGSWSKGARYCRVAARSYYNANSRYNFLGFRVVLVKK